MNISGVVNQGKKLTGFRVPNEGAIDRVMQTFDDLSTKNLVESLQTLRRGQNTGTRIDIDDLGYAFGQECHGHWDATINGKTYSNGNPHRLSAYSLTHFLKKLLGIAEKGQPKAAAVDRQILKNENKLEWLNIKKRIKSGEAEQGIRDNLLDQIFEIIRVK